MNKVERIEENIKKIMKGETVDSEIDSLKKYQSENSEEIKAINSKISALADDQTSLKELINQKVIQTKF